LYNTLALFQEEFERVDFQKEFFDDSEKLKTRFPVWM
jgi:UDP-2-acetamido-2,6-beta-L-arabino-hexul-4-ose reductase